MELCILMYFGKYNYSHWTKNVLNSLLINYASEASSRIYFSEITQKISFYNIAKLTFKVWTLIPPNRAKLKNVVYWNIQKRSHLGNGDLMMFNGIVDNVTFSKALKLMNGHTLKNFAMFISLSASARVSVILLLLLRQSDKLISI